MSNLKQKTMDCSSHIEELKNRAIFMAEHNADRTPRQPKNANREGSASMLNMNGIRYHRHQRSWNSSLAYAKAKNWQTVGSDNKINFIK